MLAWQGIVIGSVTKVSLLLPLFEPDTQRAWRMLV